MLACVIFGALAGVFSAVYALRQGMGFGEAFAIYLAVSLLGIVGVPLLCHLRTLLMRRVTQERSGKTVWSPFG